MKTKNMVYFGIFVAVLVITDCIAGKELVNFWIFIAALAISGNISRKEPERFRKLMTNTLGPGAENKAEQAQACQGRAVVKAFLRTA